MLTKSRKSLVLQLVLFLGLGSLMTAFASESNRYPRIARHEIPLLRIVPAIDGKLDQREWVNAVKLPSLVTMSGGEIATDPTDVYVGYTKDALYIGWRIFRAADAGPMKIAADKPGDQYRNTSAVWQDDCMEIYLKIGGKTINFAGNAAGAFGDTINGDSTFADSWPWRYSAQKTTDGWEGELSIDFKDLGLTGSPETGTEWYFDVIRNDKTPVTNVSYLSYRTVWNDESKLNKLIFGAAVPAARLLQCGNIDAESVGIIGECINMTEKAVDVTVEYSIFKRLPETGQFNFFQQVDSGVSNSGAQDIMTTLTPEQALAGAFKLYAPIKEERIVRTVPANGRIGLNLTTADVPVGGYVIGYRFKTSDNRILSEGLLPGERFLPVQLDIVPYYLVNETVVAQVKVRNDALAAKLAEFEVRIIQNGKTLAKNRDTARNGYDGLIVSAKDIKPGAWYCELSGYDSTGKEIAKAKKDVLRPEPPFWAVERYGTSNFVPEPWTPVAAEGNTVDVWGRTYTFNDSFLPSSIVSLGKEIMADKPQLRLVIGGNAVEWNGKNEIIEKNIEYVIYEWKGNAGVLPVTARTRVEFDGFMTIDLDMDTNGVTIDEFKVELPIRSEVAKLYHLYYSKWQQPAPKFDVKATGKIGAGFQSEFLPAIWLGNPRAGLQWCAETNEFWRNKDTQKAIEVVRNNDRTALRLQVIDRPFKTPARLSYRWGLIASPIKELNRPANRNRYYTSVRLGAGFYRGEKKDVLWAETMLNQAKALGATWVNTFHWINRMPLPLGPDIFSDPYVLEPRHRETHMEAMRMIHARGLKTTAYSGWNAMNPRMPWYSAYGEAMKMQPERYTYGAYHACPRGGYIEYMANGAAWMYNTMGIEGIYLDGMAARFYCTNRFHGCGYTNEETGERAGSYNIWAMREAFKRMYKIYHGEVNKDGLIYSHGPTILPIMSFVDVNFVWEGAAADAYFDLEAVQAIANSQTYGVPVEYVAPHFVTYSMGQGVAMLHDATVIMDYFHYFQRQNRLTGYDKSGFYGAGGTRRSFLWTTWQPRQWFDWTDGYQWHPYYENQDVLKIGAENVKASFHLNAKKQLIFCAMNFNKEATEASFALDTGKLELPGVLHARDVVTGEVFEIKDGRFSLAFLGHCPRLLVIHSAPVPDLSIDLTKLDCM
jgi:hypothetical protein